MLNLLDAPRCAALAALAATATILAALVFEHGLGYEPCLLCLRQRWPYYIGVPLAVIAIGLATGGLPRIWTAAALGLVAMVFLVSTGLGVHHAGVEWGFWPGPVSCAAGGSAAPGDLLQALGVGGRIVRCDEASWRFLGLSFSGWNAAMSLAIAGLAALGASRALRS